MIRFTLQLLSYPAGYGQAAGEDRVLKTGNEQNAESTETNLDPKDDKGEKGSKPESSGEEGSSPPASRLSDDVEAEIACA